ncbi:phenylalanine--tRNA ligase subunit beta [Caulobacter sp. Root1455]|uniref:phenylalanine--tRNA ligase subunit alpha n=1 Tax=unclassified Caulobacter TaxID=2648921 RepID=UPI0006FA6A63|nr:MULTISPECIES: phenylalanine--tRNA ligase subunit alpha [unclassified Caulobacter]KQY31139.1 phenylalanine--tRNA ligase subunit beta [Caulobacter sp. Root487D2Y]KQY95432.1 phenylalanine--tRNA ligase subunit beta [Caulobacter sp. Root1455]
MTDLTTLEADVLAQVAAAGDLAALDAVRVSALGKTGSISGLLKTLGAMSPDERKERGAAINVLRDRVQSALNDKKAALEAAALDARLASETLDLTLPAPHRRRGSVHPTMQTMDEMIAIFAEMGFAVAEGPDIEDDFHNFTALNFPEKHPAREMHDTFFFNPKESGERMLLRTHTSPVQVRTMVSQKPPIRIIAPGRTYRCDSDATHTPMFHQVEGLVIDKGIHMGHLKWTLETFIARFFETDAVTTQFRPHHFPFTEPSAEMDVQCDRSGGEIKIGQGTSWLEILGCGMVHPNVLRACGIDPDEYQGFAFGMGVDRLGMLKYGMPDLRDMFSSDGRWLDHYGFSAFAAPNAASGLS